MFHLVSRHPPEVGDPRQRLGQLLDLVEVVGHGHGLPDLGVVRHFGAGPWGGEVLQVARMEEGRIREVKVLVVGELVVGVVIVVLTEVVECSKIIHLLSI